MTSCIGCGAVIASGSRCRRRRLPKRRQGSTRAWRNLRQHVLQRDRGRCRYCGRLASHVDHVVPVVRGGPTHESNLVAACADCNLEKGAR